MQSHQAAAQSRFRLRVLFQPEAGQEVFRKTKSIEARNEKRKECNTNNYKSKQLTSFPYQLHINTGEQ